MPATRKVEVAIVGDASSMVRAFRQADSAASGFGRGGSKLMAAGIGAVAGASAVATAAIGRGLVNAIRTGVDEFQAQAKVSAQTAAALKSTGNAAGVTQKHIEDMASSLQAQTGSSDDAIQSAQNLLLTFNKISNNGPDKMFDRATQATLDLSVAFHKDLNGSAVMVGKALQDPVKGVTALSRAGVSFTASQKDTIKSLVETGQAAKAQKLILGELERQVKGSAQAFGQSTPGQIARAQRAWEDLTQNLVGAVAPAFGRILPAITQGIKGMAPVLESAATSIAKLVEQLTNSPQFQQFATALRDIAVQGVQILTKALSVLAPIVLAVVAPVAAFTAGILNSRAAMIALVASLSAFATIKAAAKITEITTALRAMAMTSGTVTLTQQLGSSLSLLATGFSGVSAKSVGLAPGLTAAQAGLGRIGTAANIAKTGLSTFATGAMTAMGGPWVVGTAAAVAVVTTLATVIGSDLVASFRGAGSAVDQYRGALANAQMAQANLQGAQAGFESSMLTYAQATREEAAARREAASAGYNDAAANQRLSAAMAAVDQARGPAAQGLGTYIQRLREGQGAVQGVAASLARAVQPIGLVDVRTREGKATWDKYQQSVVNAKSAVGSSSEWKQQQQALGRLSDYLRGLGPQYAGVAREAAKVAQMKPGPEQEAALGRLMGKLDAIKAKVAGQAPKVKIEADADQAQKTVDALKRKLDTQIKDKTITITVNTVETTSSSGGSKSKKKGSNAIEFGANNWAKLGDSLQSVFKSIRSGVASAVAGLAGMVGQYKNDKYSNQRGLGYSGDTLMAGRANTGFGGDASLREKQQALADRQALRQEKGLQDNIARLNADAEATQAEKDAAAADLADFYAQRDIERMQASIDKQVADDQKAITSLADRFKRGEIDATTFNAQLTDLIGGDTGSELGAMFGTEWSGALLEALAPLKDQIWAAMGMDSLLGGGPDEFGLGSARGQDNAPWNEWSRRKRKFSGALKTAKKDGLTNEEKASLRSEYGALSMEEWLKENPEPQRFAKGGIVTGFTRAVIGEAGPEAVIPLSSGKAKQMLADAGAAGKPVVNLTFNGVLDAKDAARMLRPELDRLVRLAV